MCLVIGCAACSSALHPDLYGQLRQRRCNFDIWDVDDRGALDIEEFQRRYPAGVPRPEDRGPLLIKGGAVGLSTASGPRQWTASFLAATAGDVEMEALEHSKDTAHGLYHYSRGGPTRKITLGKFFDTKGVNATGYGDQYIFQRTHFMEPEWHGLGSEFEVPRWSGASIRSQEIFFAIGPVGSGLAFHKHGEAWNIVTSGAKWWVLFPPGDFDSMEHRAMENGLMIRNAGENGALMAAWLDGRSSAHDDVPGANHARTDGYPQGFERGYECIQEAGDIVFVPRNWYHAVVNLVDNTVGIAGQPSPSILGFDGKAKSRDKTKNENLASVPEGEGADSVQKSSSGPKITEAEFLTMYASAGLKLKEQREMFDQYDLDKNGVLDPKEIRFVKLRSGEV